MSLAPKASWLEAVEPKDPQTLLERGIEPLDIAIVHRRLSLPERSAAVAQFKGEAKISVELISPEDEKSTGLVATAQLVLQRAKVFPEQWLYDAAKKSSSIIMTRSEYLRLQEYLTSCQQETAAAFERK